MNDEEYKLDKVYKAALNREFTSTSKEWYEETPSKEVPVKLSNVWIDDIPSVPPPITTEVVEMVQDLILTEDRTVLEHKTWFTCETPGLLNTRLQDFIQPSKGYDIKYHVKLYDNSGKQVYIGEELEWEFDYLSGIVFFKEDPLNKYVQPFHLYGYRYVGRYGSLDDLSGGSASGETGATTLDEAYDGGRTIEADEGPIRITASNGSSSLQVDPINYTPVNNLAPGQIVNREGILYIYDESRATWISMIRQAIAFGAKRADGVFMNLSNFTSNMSGWPALRKGMIVGITAQASGGYSRKHIDIKIKGDENNLFGFDLFDHYYSNGNMDISFNENDLLQILVSSQYEMTYGLIINLEIAWRLS